MFIAALFTITKNRKLKCPLTNRSRICGIYIYIVYIYTMEFY